MQAPSPPPEHILLSEVLAYCKARDVAHTRFGREAANDGSLIADLINGRELRRSTRDAVRHYMLTGKPSARGVRK